MAITNFSYFKSFQAPTSNEARQLKNIAYVNVLNAEGPSGVEDACETLYDFFYKGYLPLTDQNVVMEKYGAMPITARRIPAQGTHPMSMIHPQPEIWFAYFKNRHQFRTTISTQDEDIQNFTKEEDYKKQMMINSLIMKNSWREFKNYKIMQCFGDDAEIKKYGEGVPANKGCRSFMDNYIEIHQPSTGTTKGYKMYEGQKTGEELFGLWKNPSKANEEYVGPGPFKADGTWDTSTTDYKRWINTDHPLKDLLSLVNKAIYTNEITAKKSDLEIFKTAGMDDLQKMLGWYDEIVKTVTWMCLTKSAKYNIGIDNSTGILHTNLADLKSKKIGKKTYILGLANPRDPVANADYDVVGCNNVQCKKEDLLILMHIDNKLEMTNLLRIQDNNSTLTVSADAFGVGKLVFAGWVKKDRALIIHKNALNFYIHKLSTGTARYAENLYTNDFVDLDESFGLFPWPSYSVKKPA